MMRFINSVFFKPTTILLAIVMLSVPFTAGATPNGQVTLRAGTMIPLELMTAITSKNVTAGNFIDFRVISDIETEGKVVIQEGSIARGQITRLKKNGVFGKPGELEISVRSVTAIDGKTINLSSGKVSEEGDDRLVLSICVTAFLCILGFLIKGKNAEIPAGTRCDAMVGNNTTINVD
jgi:hypothetical protein